MDSTFCYFGAYLVYLFIEQKDDNITHIYIDSILETNPIRHGNGNIISLIQTKHITQTVIYINNFIFLIVYLFTI